jgi:hypothetical protein
VSGKLLVGQGQGRGQARGVALTQLVREGNIVSRGWEACSGRLSGRVSRRGWKRLGDRVLLVTRAWELNVYFASAASLAFFSFRSVRDALYLLAKVLALVILR